MTEEQKKRSAAIHKIADELRRCFPGIKTGDAEAKQLLEFIEKLDIPKQK